MTEDTFELAGTCTFQNDLNLDEEGRRTGGAGDSESDSVVSAQLSLFEGFDDIPDEAEGPVLSEELAHFNLFDDSDEDLDDFSGNNLTEIHVPVTDNDLPDEAIGPVLSEEFAHFSLFDGSGKDFDDFAGNNPTEIPVTHKDKSTDNTLSAMNTMHHQRRHLARISNNTTTNNNNNTKTVEFTGPTPDDDNYCAICRDYHREPKTLNKCSHSFCTECIDEYFKVKPTCPICFTPYGVITGNMPEGNMRETISKTRLPGYESYNTIVISYSFCDGTQTAEHPNPGEAYYGTDRTAYLPNNAEGQKVLKLLKVAFHRRLTFTVGRSRTTGCDNVVTWNDIHHKTVTHGGQDNFGYPDPTYLSRVQEELAAKGVTEESIK